MPGLEQQSLKMSLTAKSGSASKGGQLVTGLWSQIRGPPTGQIWGSLSTKMMKFSKEL